MTAGHVIGPDGTIYAAGNDGILHALDPATGADRWTHEAGDELSTSPARATRRHSAVGHTGNQLVAFSAAGTVDSA